MFRKKSVKRVWAGLLALLAVLPVSLSVGGVIAQASQPPAVEIIVHKYLYEDGEVKYDPDTGEVTKDGAYFENDGTVQTAPNGLTPFNPDEEISTSTGKVKLGDIEFTLVDISAYLATGKTTKEVLAEIKTGNAYDPSKYEDFISRMKTAYSAYTQTQKVVYTAGPPEDSAAKFTNVPKDKNQTYIILETKAGPYITQRSVPMIISVPMTNPNGNGFLDVIHLYGKNQITEVGLEVTKYSEKMQNGSELAGAVFNLYKGTPGSGAVLMTDGTYAAPGTAGKTPVNFVTDADGKLSPSITGLEAGSYYLVEIGFMVAGEVKDTDSQGNMKSPNALNDADNKLTFTIAAGETGEKVLKFVNFIKPDVEKDITNGSISEGQKGFDVGDEVEYETKLYIPTDINGGTVVTRPDGSTEISLAYTQFYFQDTHSEGLTFNGTNLSAIQFYEANGTTPISFTDSDVTFSLISRGFQLDFIRPGGGVSSTLAAYAGKTIVLKYKMTINDKAVVDIGEDNIAKIIYSNGPVTGSDQDCETAYTGGYRWQKTGEEAADASGLNGARFVVLNKDGKYYRFNTVANAVEWVDDIDDATEIVAQKIDGVDGVVEIKGLAYGDYQLQETYAPDPYQLLVNPIDFTVSKDSYTNAVQTGEYLYEIENKKKPEIPITGGIGTVIFSIAGLSVMGMSGIYLVKKRRQA